MGLPDFTLKNLLCGSTPVVSKATQPVPPVPPSDWTGTPFKIDAHWTTTKTKTLRFPCK